MLMGTMVSCDLSKKIENTDVSDSENDSLSNESEKKETEKGKESMSEKKTQPVVKKGMLSLIT